MKFPGGGGETGQASEQIYSEKKTITVPKTPLSPDSIDGFPVISFTFIGNAHKNPVTLMGFAKGGFIGFSSQPVLLPRRLSLSRIDLL
ncbi:hypothetical protein AB8880_01265 [Alphaproteobacteria bacterium LSUCC0684]